jgi:hypothetical protein
MRNVPLQLLDMLQFSRQFQEYNDRRSSSIPEETELLEQMLATGLHAY